MHSGRVNEQACKVVLPQLELYIFTCPLTGSFKPIWHLNNALVV